MAAKAGLPLLRTQAFRIVLVYVVLFAVSVAALLGFTYWNTRRTLDAQTDQIIQAEITGLSDVSHYRGLAGLAEVVRERSLREGQSIYVLSDGLRHIIAGNLDAWPRTLTKEGNFVEFNYERPVDGQLEMRQARGRIFALSGDFVLLVAQDVHERSLITHMFTTTLPWTVGLILLLGLLGGALMSRNMLRRLDSINKTSGEIIAGDLSRRVPLAGSGDEFDTLAENLNRMLDRIERLMKGLREVTDSVAHDLRTPLNRLRNRLEEVQSGRSHGSVEAGEIDRAIAEADQLIATFNALLLIAETDAGATRAGVVSLDLGAMMADVVELYEPLAEERNIRLVRTQINARAPTPTIEGNRSLIAQALANLVDNAIKYTPEGGQVAIACDANGESGIDLSVADSGPGIEAGDRARVVERFVRLEASRNSPGTGLGLSLVAAVAHFHNAELLLLDNQPHGLKAVLRFPRSIRRASPRQAAAE